MKKLISILFLIMGVLVFGKEYTIGITQFAEHPALDAARQGFLDELKKSGVDAKINYKNAQGDTGVAGMIAKKFVSDKVDLIFAIATPTAQSAKQATNTIPVVFSAITDPVRAQLVKDLKNVGGNVTGTSDAAPVEKQMELFKKINPNVKKVAILYNTSEANSEVQIEKATAIGKKIGIEIVPVGVNNINDIPQAVNSVVRKVDGFYTIADNIVASSIKIISKTAIKNKKILIAAEEGHLQGGALMTDGLSYYEIGKQAGHMAKEILVDGKNPKDIPVEISKNTKKVVNTKTMKELGLSKDLPAFAGAEFID